MIISHRLVLIAALEELVSTLQQNLKGLYAGIAQADATGQWQESASAMHTEARDQSVFIRRLQDLLEEQQAAIRRAI